MKPRILIVEDESLIAMLLEDILTDAGYIADATATNVEQAMSMIEAGSFDAAILDVNLGGSASFPAAEILRSRGFPSCLQLVMENKDFLQHTHPSLYC